MNANVPPRKTVKYQGVEITLYSVGWLAHLTQRTSESVRRWALQGLLPPPLLDIKDNSKKRRWYTLPEITGYASIIKAANIRRRVPIESTDFQHNAKVFRSTLHEAMLKNPSVLIGKIANIEEIKKSVSGKVSKIASRASIVEGMISSLR